LLALLAFGYWGFVTGEGAMKWGLAVGLPVLVAIVWAVFVAPKAAARLPRLAKLVLGLVILEAAAVALAAAGQPGLATWLAIVVLANAALILIWRQ
jgi:hypothetical protein